MFISLHVHTDLPGLQAIEDPQATIPSNTRYSTIALLELTYPLDSDYQILKLLDQGSNG